MPWAADGTAAMSSGCSAPRPRAQSWQRPVCPLQPSSESQKSSVSYIKKPVSFNTLRELISAAEQSLLVSP